MKVDATDGVTRDVAPEWPSSSYPPGYQFQKLPPILSPMDPNVTCGRSAFDSAHKTETADVLAGSEVGFRVSVDGNGNRGAILQDYYHNTTFWEPYIWHPGPGFVYLSRAPDDDLQSYRGDGDWFKIAYAGPANDTDWILPMLTDVSVFFLSFRFPPLHTTADLMKKIYGC